MTAVQKKLRNLFLLGFVGALAAWLLFYTLGRKEEREVEKKETERVLPSGLSVVRVALTTPESSFELERSEDGWRLLSPLATAAEKTTVDGMVDFLLGLERIRLVGKNRDNGKVEPPEELWLFALEPPRFTVTLTDDGGDEVVLLVGKKNTFDGSIYVKLDDAPEVVQVDGALEYQVDKNLYQLRDKRLVAIEEAAVTRLAVAPAEGVAWAVEKRGDDWEIVEPRRLPADRAQVTGMLSALANVRAKEFVSEEGNERARKEYGLEQPTVRVEITAGSMSPEVWLTRQQQGNDTVYYAMRAGEHPIVQLSSDWVFKKVNIALDALRDRRVLRFDRDAVRRLTLSRGEERLVFEKVADEAGRDDWRMVEPEAGDADDATLTGILYRLSTMKAKTVIKEQATEEDLKSTGVSPPEVTVEIGGADGILGTVRFSKELDGERLANSGRRLDLVEASVVSDLSFAPGDYQPVQPPE